MNLWQKKLIGSVRPYLKKIGSEHGLDHSERVFKYCLFFSEDYKKINLDSLFAAAYLHDFGYLKNVKGGLGHGILAIDDIVFILNKLNLPEEKINLVKKIIAIHDSHSNLLKMKLPREALIFHDADKMDGSGAIGVARQFVYTGRVGRKIWDPKKKRNPSLPYGGNFSAVHSLLDYHLKHIFYTKKARQMALERKKYMRNFVKQFLREWNFKK